MSEQIPFIAPFIVLEGDEGTGKGTVATEVVERLVAKGIEVVHTREPGGTRFGEMLRKELLLCRDEPLEKCTHVLLHQAYRAEHINKVILPALTSGKVVVCERFAMSTLALNVIPYTQTHPELYEMFMATMSAVAGNLVEPVTFLLDVPDDIRELRMLGRVRDHYESRPKSELDATSSAYKMLHKHPTTIVLDGTKPSGDLADHIVAQIEVQIEQAKAAAQSFIEQEAECSVNPTADDEEVIQVAEIEEPFDLEKEINGFLDEHLVPSLFNNNSDEIDNYRDVARTLVLTMYNATKDNDIFRGHNRDKMRVQLHSIIYYGHQLDLLRNKTVAVTPAE